MDKKAMYKLSYGLFVVTVKEAEKDNGCITNTVMQVTSTPNRISLAVNKENYTHGMIERTGKFNVSVLRGFLLKSYNLWILALIPCFWQM